MMVEQVEHDHVRLRQVRSARPAQRRRRRRRAAAAAPNADPVETLAAARGLAGLGLRSPRRRQMKWTSMSPLPRTIPVTREPLSRDRATGSAWACRRRCASRCARARTGGAPRRRCAPGGWTTSPPSDSASRRWACSALPVVLRHRVGVAAHPRTTATHGARRPAAIRRAPRMIFADDGLGPTQTRMRSAAGQVASMSWSRR